MTATIEKDAAAAISALAACAMSQDLLLCDKTFCLSKATAHDPLQASQVEVVPDACLMGFQSMFKFIACITGGSCALWPHVRVPTMFP